MVLLSQDFLFFIVRNCLDFKSRGDSQPDLLRSCQLDGEKLQERFVGLHGPNPLRSSEHSRA